MLERDNDKKIIIGTKFQSKMKCFECFKNLIRKETFELVNENTQKVPLNQVNELLEEDYIYVYIMDKLEEERGRKNIFENNEKIWIRDVYDVDDSIEELIDPFFNAEYVFLFTEDNEEYIFLGLYKLMTTDINSYSKEWKKQSEYLFSLNKIDMKNTIEENNYCCIEKYIADRERLKELLSEHGEKYEYLPDDLKNDEELCLIALESTNGGICKYAGKELLRNKEFAKKVLKKYGYGLQYFSKEIRDDLEICQISTFDYRYASENIHKNKALALEILKGQVYDVKYIDKELRKDKDIIEEYWKNVKQKWEDYLYLHNMCSVIGIDSFGNKIIDEFLKIEKERHTLERISQYEEQTEIVQFVKTKEDNCFREPNMFYTNFNKEIFDKEFDFFIILIGKKENAISKQIKEKYQRNDETNCICMIEIYTQDTYTYNPKLITKDTNQIMDLLRVITYDTTDSSDISLEYDGLECMKSCLKELAGNNNIEIYRCEGTIKEIKQKINEIQRSFQAKLYMIQLVYNNKIDVYTRNSIFRMLYDVKKNKYIGYYSSHECNIENIEIIIMKTDLKLNSY